MSTFEPEPESCWQCARGRFYLPFGGEHVDCPPANWKRQSCAAKLLATIEKPFRSFPVAMLGEGLSEAKA